MLLFDPEDGLTWDQTMELVLRTMPPETRARLERESAVSGRALEDLVVDSVVDCLERLNDPAYRAAWEAKLAWEEQPYGPDPLLKRPDGAA